MDQSQVRQYVEKYIHAFGAHVMESHPTFLSVKLTEKMDKDIGNRPFYWSWVEKMGIPAQPMIVTFFFDPENVPQEMKGEILHFGSSRLQQIFRSTRENGKFVCMYEHHPVMQKKGVLSSRRSTPLTPWLNLNVKISFICDKRKDFLLSLGINLHQPRIVQNFTDFVGRLQLSPRWRTRS